MSCLKKQVVNFLIVFAMVIFTGSEAQALDGRWYLGGGVGKAFPGFSLTDDLDKSVPLTGTLAEIAGTDTFILQEEDGFTGPSYKIFFGRTFGSKEKHAVELSYFNLGDYYLDIGGSVHNETDVYDGSFEFFQGAQATFDVQARGTGRGAIKAYGISYVFFQDFGKDKKFTIFPKVGLGYVTASARASVLVRGEAALEKEEDGITYRVGVFAEARQSLAKDFGSITPIIGLGLGYRINKNWRLRLELDRIGVPPTGGLVLGDPHVDVWTAGFMYSFPKKR